MSEREIKAIVALMEKESKKISKSDSAAKSLLMSVGIMTKNGHIRKAFRGPCITQSHH